jgi:hypothetical protein
MSRYWQWDTRPTHSAGFALIQNGLALYAGGGH